MNLALAQIKKTPRWVFLAGNKARIIEAYCEGVEAGVDW